MTTATRPPPAKGGAATDPNTTTLCGSCRAGECMCGGDCDCRPCAARLAKEEGVRYLETLQFGGREPICLARGTATGAPGPTLCGIDRFAKGGPGWSLGGGVTGPGYRHEACPGCVSVARRRYPDLPVVGMACLSELFAVPLGVRTYSCSTDVPGLRDEMRAAARAFAEAGGRG
jgi:hypothetical protein